MLGRYLARGRAAVIVRNRRLSFLIVRSRGDRFRGEINKRKSTRRETQRRWLPRRFSSSQSPAIDLEKSKQERKDSES
jgi:hypothetical protein